MRSFKTLSLQSSENRAISRLNCPLLTNLLAFSKLVLSFRPSLQAVIIVDEDDELF